MWISQLQIENIKSFRNTQLLEFSKGINLLVGPNNSGKSILLRCLNGLQSGAINFKSFLQNNVRVGAKDFGIRLQLAEPDGTLMPLNPDSLQDPNWRPIVLIKGHNQTVQATYERGGGGAENVEFPCLFNREPKNLIYPFLSNRKPQGLSEAVAQEHVESVAETLQMLHAKIDRLTSPSHEAHEQFRTQCKALLGFEVFSYPSRGGKQSGLVMGRVGQIAIDAMGEGTLNLLGLLVNLCVAEGKVFLIEELENDIHPAALKLLLELIREKALCNQFFISTHSHIVVKHLGADPDARIFALSMELSEKVPLSKIEPVRHDAVARITLLEGLGYDVFDFDLWKGYLILEESTAERIIRDVLIPLFSPSLQPKLKTIAAGGAEKLSPTLEDFLRLFVFIHTSDLYQGRAWILADGGTLGTDIIAKLKSKFSSWPPDHFRALSEENIERYYPAAFQEEVSRVLQMPHGLPKQHAKGDLVRSVVKWALEDEARARDQFAQCAAEIIVFLREVETKLADLV
jgi:predicted ATPase